MTSASLENPPDSRAVSRGVWLIVAGAFLVPSLDTAAKILAEDHGMPVGQIALARFVLQTVMVLPFVLAVEGWNAVVEVRHPGLNLLRGVLLAFGTIVFFLALKAMPLADAIAIFFVQPMIVTLLSVVFLGEAFDLKRVAAVVVGFGGALLVIRPNFAALGLVATLPLVCAVFVSIYLVLGRHMSATTSSLVMHVYAGIGGTLTMAVLLLAGAAMDVAELQVIPPVGFAVWGLMIVVGLVATVAHLLFIQAYRLAPVTLLAPFGYFEIVSATLFGFVVFGDFPDAGKWLGIAIIVASGLLLVWADRAAASRAPPPEAV